jgi:hypothetical protein
MVLDLSSALKGDIAITIVIYEDECITREVGSVLVFEFLKLEKELPALSIIKQLEEQPGIQLTFPEEKPQGRVYVFLSHGIDALELSNIVTSELKSIGCRVCHFIKRFTNEDKMQYQK